MGCCSSNNGVDDSSHSVPTKRVGKSMTYQEEDAHVRATEEAAQAEERKGDDLYGDTDEKDPDPLSTGQTDYRDTDNEVKVHVLRARGLPKMDGISGKADPYVVVTCGDKQFQTRIVRYTLRPVWNATFIFRGVGMLTKCDFVQFDMWDFDRAKKDDYMGQCRIQGLQKYRNRCGHPQWIKLRDKEGKELPGELLVQINVVDDANTLSIRDWTHVVELTLKGGTNLSSLDWFSKSDPYVRIEWGTQLFTSKKLQNTENPIWNDKAVIFIHKTKQSQYHMKFTVMDEDLRTDDLIGAGIISAETLFADTERTGTWKGEVPLSKVNINSDKLLSAGNLKAVAESEAQGGNLNVAISLYERKHIESKFYHALIEKFDSDNDGELDQFEVKDMVTRLHLPTKDADVEEFFRRYDDDGNKKWSKTEITAMLEDFHFQRSEWLTSLLNEFLTGGRKIGATDAHFMRGVTRSVQDEKGVINVRHRMTGLVIQEHIPTYVWVALKLMYSSKTGQYLSRVISPMLETWSVRKGAQYDSPESKSEIKSFIKLHGLDTDLVAKPIDEFQNFNDFFARPILMSERKIEEPDNERVFLSPADCRLSAFDSIVDSNVWVKGSRFSVPNLLGPCKELAPQFEGCAFIIARLAPQDYHRWHWPVSGVIKRIVPIEGPLYTVNPIAVNTKINVYTENKRCVIEIDTGNLFGTVIMIAIAATMVGSYKLFQKDGTALEVGQTVRRGEVSGEFRFGGSTVLLLLEHGRIEIDNDLTAHSAKRMETLIDVRDRIGVAKALD